MSEVAVGGGGEVGGSQQSSGSEAQSSAPVAPAQDAQSSQPPQTREQAEQRAAEEIKKYKFKRNVFGQEEEVEFDEPSIQRELSKARAFELKNAQYKEAAQAASRILELAKASPLDFLRETGADTAAIVKNLLEQQQRMQQMTPEQRELEARQQEFEQREAALQAKMQEIEARETEYRWKQWSADLPTALQANGLKNDGATLRRIAEVGKEHADVGIVLTAQEAAQIVAKQQREQTEALLKTMDREMLLKLLGPQAEEISRAVAERVTRTPAQPPAPAPVTEEPSAEEPKYHSQKEVFAALRRMKLL